MRSQTLKRLTQLGRMEITKDKQHRGDSEMSSRLRHEMSLKHNSLVGG